ncbi:hypothetical protein CHUAL_004238 [Chamberlinius hualienensis]
MAKRTKDNNFMFGYSIAEQLAREAARKEHMDLIKRPSSTSNNLPKSPPKQKPIEPTKKTPKPSPATSFNYNQLLNLASSKQHEPIELPRIPKKKVVDADVQGRLMTNDEKRKFVEEQARKQGRSVTSLTLPPHSRRGPRFKGEDEKNIVVESLMGNGKASPAPKETKKIPETIKRPVPPGHPNPKVVPKLSNNQSKASVNSDKRLQPKNGPQDKRSQTLSQSVTPKTLQKSPIKINSASKNLGKSQEKFTAAVRKAPPTNGVNKVKGDVRTQPTNGVNKVKGDVRTQPTNGVNKVKGDVRTQSQTPAPKSRLPNGPSSTNPSVSNRPMPKNTNNSSVSAGKAPINMQKSVVNRVTQQPMGSKQPSAGREAMCRQPPPRKPSEQPRPPINMQRRPPPQQPPSRGMMPPSRRPLPPREMMPPPRRPFPPSMRPPMKRRIESDDEFDEEMADFIDDGPIDDGFDYSTEIKAIFGYDKARYHDDDGDIVESNFAQQMKEEALSTRMGILEDLEDIQREQDELVRAKKTRKKLKK